MLPDQRMFYLPSFKICTAYLVQMYSKYYRAAVRNFKGQVTWENVNILRAASCQLFLKKISEKLIWILITCMHSMTNLTFCYLDILKYKFHCMWTNFRTDGCHPLLRIDGWISTHATRSNGGPEGNRILIENMTLPFHAGSLQQTSVNLSHTERSGLKNTDLVSIKPAPVVMISPFLQAPCGTHLKPSSPNS